MLTEDGEKIEVVEEAKAISKWPWFIDMWLYPLNWAGIVQVVTLLFSIHLFCPIVMWFFGLGLGIEYMPIVYTFPIAYMFFSFTECIRYSSTGRFRTPDLLRLPNAGRWDFVSQLFVVIGSIAACFCAAAIYFIFTSRTDRIFWLILAGGGFFFPMILLAVVLFDSFNALNPILILGSIKDIFLPYCGLIFAFYVGSFFLVKIHPHLHLFSDIFLGPVALICRALQFYLMFVGAGALGRFYYCYQDRLNWEV